MVPDTYVNVPHPRAISTVKTHYSSHSPMLLMLKNEPCCRRDEVSDGVRMLIYQEWATGALPVCTLCVVASLCMDVHARI